MAKSSSNRFSALDYVLIHSSKRGRRGIFLTFLFVLLILVFGNVYFYIAGRNQLLEYVMLERQSVAELAATMIQERLYRVIDVGTSLATRVAFRDRVSEGNWDAAIEIMESVPEDFSYIDRVALFDPQGTFWAATSPTPEILSVIGENFSYRDYYQGVSKNWEPFVGEAIKPAVPLGYNLVPVAIPIKAESEEVLGFLLLNIKLDTLVVWAQNIDAGPEGFLYFVDHKGHLVAHPTLLPAEEIIDFSSDETVQKVLAGEAGAEVLVDQEKDKLKIVAYAPVPDFGWGVILEQPRAAALAPFFGNLLMSLVLQGVFLVVILVSLTFMMVSFLELSLYRERERALLQSLGDGVVAIDRDWTITHFNPMAETITGWAAEDVIGKSFKKTIPLIRKRDKKENLKFILDAMAKGKPQKMRNHTLLVRKDGKEIPVGDTAAPILSEDGRVMGVIIVFRDLTLET